MALFIFFLLSGAFAKSPEGYPAAAVNIVYENEAVIKNDFCFPVVISVNNKDLMIEARSSFRTGLHKWTAWSWMPGKINGLINSKTVSWPLRGQRKISYGPEETETHRSHDSYGYDFDVPVGTPVLAMERGIVIRVLQKYEKAHRDLSKKDETNTIEVLHEDGTVARYSHIRPGSAKVKHCEKISVGQTLAESGNVGFSGGPHLHVDVIRPVDGEKYRTIPLKFR